MTNILKTKSGVKYEYSLENAQFDDAFKIEAEIEGNNFYMILHRVVNFNLFHSIVFSEPEETGPTNSKIARLEDKEDYVSDKMMTIK